MKTVIAKAGTPNSIIRQLGNYGKQTGPRTGKNKRTAQSNEAYIIRRFIKWRLAQNDFEFPVSVYHRESPDFQIIEKSSTTLCEFTEASSSKAGETFSKVSQSLLSEDLGYPITSRVVDEVISDIESALRRKSQKDYAGAETDLIIYPNSPERMAIGLFGSEDNKWDSMVLNYNYDVSNFRKVYLYWYEKDRIFTLLGNQK